VSRFLLVSLNIEAILQETTLHRRREKLGKMTNGLGLGDAYDGTIRRIKAQKGDRARLGMDALMWISHSERPLTVDEICDALAVEIGSTDMNTNNLPSICTVLSCCQGLAAVDEGSSTIRLVHFTLKEYLSSQADLFDRPHSKIAETCLTYLLFQTVKNLPTSRHTGERSHSPIYLRADMRVELLGCPPFLGYSTLCWGTHMRMEPSDRSRYLALDLLDRFDSHRSAELLSKSTFETCVGFFFKPFSALRCVSYFGIDEVAIDLIRTKRWDVNQRDGEGMTLLMSAARYGREKVVKFLLQQKPTQPDMADTRYSRTALSWAAESGHDAVVKLLLRPLFVNPGSIGRWRGTALVMALLFKRKYVNPNRQDNDGQTPLSLAAQNGYDGIVKLLLARDDVSPDRLDNSGRTPLLLAAGYGHDGITKLLLGRDDVNPDRPDNYGQTPLSWAAEHGREGIVKLLLARDDVSLDRLDNYGRTPLLWAARCRYNGTVGPDNYCRAPLWWAARCRYDRTVKLLLARDDVSPDRPDNDGRTPLSLAAGYGCEGVVKLLLARDDVSPDRPDNDGRTPLWWAANNGYDGIVKLLLARDDVNPDRPDNYGRALVSLAAKRGCEGIVKLLLARDDVSPDRPDDRGRTPLSWAAGSGYGGVVELLLGREDVSPDMPDNDGKTPLSWAAERGCDRVVKLLLARDDVSPDRPDNHGQTPLS